MSSLIRLFRNVRIIIFIVFLLAALLSINPAPWQEGVAVRSICNGSAAADAGIPNPKPSGSPRSREIIISINNRPIASADDYAAFAAALSPDQPLTLKTTEGVYRLQTRAKISTTVLNETETVMLNETVEVNETVNGSVILVNRTVPKKVTRNKVETEIVGVEDLGLRVYDAPTTNIRRGLDLEGGSRILLEPEKQVSPQEIELIISNMKQRLNVYGLSDIVVREVRDLSGKSFVLVELAGATEEEARSLISRQGKFEAKIGNDTAFRGGDVTYVCTSAECSGLDPNAGCARQGSDWLCRFRFSITLSKEGAAQQAAITQELDVVDKGGEQYLSKQIDLFLDDSLVDSLNIGADLKGRDVSEISISGSGTGLTQEEASFDAFASMKQLQTMLSTGSLPVKMNVVKMDTISAVLGERFTRNAITVGVAAILLVTLVIFIRYRAITIALPVILTMSSEVFILLGVAAFIGWNLDLAAIAGIILATGTGVDDQIVIVDEALRGRGAESVSWKEKLKRAFFIIFSAYFATVVAMFPLLLAGAGLLKGFAFTTIIGVTVGVLVTRPAYAVIVEALHQKE